MIELQYILAIGLVLLVTVGYLIRRRPKGFPPGPLGYPIVGNFLQLGHHREETFRKWGEKYGDILGVRLGPANFVVLNNYKHIKEALSMNELSGRQVTRPLKDRNRGGVRGIVFNEGLGWSEQRRFALKHLKDFGFGKSSMEVLVMDEVNELIKNLSKTAGQPISTTNRFNSAVINALWSIVAGKRYDHDDPVLADFMKRITEIVSDPTILSVLSRFFPSVYYLRKIFPNIFPNPNKEFQVKIYSFFDEIIKDHKATIQPGCPRDFLDVYLDEMANTNDPHSSFYKEEGEHSVFVTMLDLFVAGAETTSSTLTWAFLLLAMHQDDQEKLVQEILTVVGNSRNVSLTDRPHLIRLEATILEVLRFSALASLGVPHRAMEDVKFHNYIIPKNTTIMANLYSASRDKSAWGDPDNFRPARFISADGKTLVRNEALMPFAIGKRICPGQTLAQDELFLFLGNLVQRFHIKTEQKDYQLQVQSMGTRMPKPHNLILRDRFVE